MKKIGAYQAKTHLSELLEKVKRGESFTITKRDESIAVLAPINRAHPALKVETVIKRMRAFRRKIKLGHLLLKGCLWLPWIVRWILLRRN